MRCGIQGKLPAKRDFISPDQMLKFMFDDLMKVPERDRRFIRYFTLTHLHNNPAVQACIYRANPTSLGPLRTASRAHRAGA